LIPCAILTIPAAGTPNCVRTDVMSPIAVSVSGVIFSKILSIAEIKLVSAR